MNSCVLMATVVRNPQLRYTQDNQTPVAEMLVEFEGVGSNDAPSTLKVVGWGNLATSFPDNYTEGDKVIIEGRLSMRVIERPEGYKEKRAELVASHVHSLGKDGITSPRTDNVVNLHQNQPQDPTSFDSPATETLSQPSNVESTSDLDDIPF